MEVLERPGFIPGLSFLLLWLFEFPRIRFVGNSVNSARSRSYAGGAGPGLRAWCYRTGAVQVSENTPSETVRKVLIGSGLKPKNRRIGSKKPYFVTRNYQNRGFRCHSNPFSDSLSRQLGE